jgi:DNA-binding NtrC family response regulator
VGGQLGRDRFVRAVSSTPPSAELLASASPSLAGVLSAARRGAVTEAPVLILGEPGTGRTSLARVVHEVSPRHAGPLVEVDPATLPSSLFESEFFGHLPGAFTGAAERARGRIERARGGSLLLDHVEETPLGAQVKLLRLIAEQRYAPLGGEERRADVRFLAIAPPDLPERVKVGTFRADLFYRLEVLTLSLPPLRERMDDLGALVRHFLEDLGERFGREVPGLTDEALEWMQTYSWPGNLRELRNVLERELLTSRGSHLDPSPPARTGSRPRTLLEVEKEQVVRALEYTRGHQGRAAELLGISRKTLWEKRRRFGLP